jgi:ubiquinone/menaquinone biosynthesis C-methylase UbiE
MQYESFYKDFWDNEYDKNFWNNEYEKRESTHYYRKRYDKFKDWLGSFEGKTIIDIGGGYGHLLRYLEIKEGTIIDISESGLVFAREKFGYNTIQANIQKRFPVKEQQYDVAFLFEVLEHLQHGNKCLSEIHNILKDEGILYVAQPTCPPDGTHHVRQYFLNNLQNDFTKCGFKIEDIKFIPVFIYREEFLNNYRGHMVNLLKKIFWLFCYLLTFIPRVFWEGICRLIPNSRLVSLYLIKARKVPSELIR